MIRAGAFHGVLDICTGGIIENLFQGNRDPGPDRLTAAVETGIPMVLAPCGLDILSYGGRADMLEKTKDRPQYVQDSLRVQVRTSADELRQAADRSQQALEFAAAIDQYTQALDWLRASGQDHSTAELDLLLARNESYWSLGDLPAVIDQSEAALKLARELQDPLREARVLIRQIEAMNSTGRPTEAKPLAKRALKLAREAADRKLEADSLAGLGGAYIYLSDYAHAKTYYEEALALYREVGDKAGQAQCLRRLGWVAQDTGNLSLAKEYQQSSVALYREINDRDGMARALNMLALASIDFAEQRDYEEEALEIFKALGNRTGQALMYGNLGGVYMQLGLYGTARDYMERAAQMNRDLQATSYLANAYLSLGDLNLAHGEYDLVEPWLTEGLQLAEAADDPKSVSLYWLELGRLGLARGEYQKAHAAFEKMDEMAHQLSMPAWTAQALTLMGAASLGLGKIEVARRETSSAIRQLEMLGDVTSDVQPQEVWWWRYQALKTDGRPKTEDR